MSDTESTTENETTAPVVNGASTTTPTDAKPKSAKPWIAAGFKSRDEMRAANGKKAGKKIGPPKGKTMVSASKEKAAKLGAKKKAKVVKKPKLSAKPKAAKKAKKVKAKKPTKVKASAKASATKSKVKKHHYPVTAAEKRKAAERTAAFKKSLRTKEEPNKDETTVLRSVKVGGETSIEKLAAKFSGTLSKRKSRVRNALRWVVAAKKFKKIERGTYKRIAS